MRLALLAVTAAALLGTSLAAAQILGEPAAAVGPVSQPIRGTTVYVVNGPLRLGDQIVQTQEQESMVSALATVRLTDKTTLTVGQIVTTGTQGNATVFFADSVAGGVHGVTSDVLRDAMNLAPTDTPIFGGVTLNGNLSVTGTVAFTGVTGTSGIAKLTNGVLSGTTVLAGINGIGITGEYIGIGGITNTGNITNSGVLTNTGAANITGTITVTAGIISPTGGSFTTTNGTSATRVAPNTVYLTSPSDTPSTVLHNGVRGISFENNSGVSIHASNLTDTWVSMRGGNFTVRATDVFGWRSSSASGLADTGLLRGEAGVITGSSGTWFQATAGRSRVTSNVDNATATMANITGLSATVKAGRKYSGEMVIYCSTDVEADGIKIDFDGGTATMTSFQAHYLDWNDVGPTSARTSALATDFEVAALQAGTCLHVKFSFVCNAAGTFIPRFAQVAHTTGTATVTTNSFMLIEDVP